MDSNIFLLTMSYNTEHKKSNCETKATIQRYHCSYQIPSHTHLPKLLLSYPTIIPVILPHSTPILWFSNIYLTMSRGIKWHTATNFAKGELIFFNDNTVQQGSATTVKACRPCVACRLIFCGARTFIQ